MHLAARYCSEDSCWAGRLRFLALGAVSLAMSDAFVMQHIMRISSSDGKVKWEAHARDFVHVGDRKFIKLYQLIRARALLFHGGSVRREDLILMRYIGDRNEDFSMLREKVDALLRLG